MEEREPARRMIAAALWQWKWVIVLCTALATASALLLSLSQEKQYTASATLLFRDPGFDRALFGSSFFVPSTDPERVGSTNVGLASLPVIADHTAARLKLSAGVVLREVEVSQRGQSDLVAVAATDHRPAVSALIANTFAQQYIEVRRAADRAKLQSARKLLDAQIAATPNKSDAKALRERSQELRVLASLQTGNAEVVQPAEVPGSPSSPSPLRDALLGGLLGLLLGVALAMLLQRIDRRLKDPKDLAEVFTDPILGVVPHSRAFATGGTRSHADIEAFRLLRANLRYSNVDHEMRSLLVTSAGQGEGKSTIAWHLSSEMAAAGTRVLLVEGDMRNPALSHRNGLKGPGLSGVLAGENLAAAIISPARPTAGGPDGDDAFDILPAGPQPPNPVKLLESERMAGLFRELEARYEFVIVDTPPTAGVADAIPLLSLVDGVVVVARVGKTTRDAALHIGRQLANMRAPVVGIVINDLPRRRAPTYAYSYSAGNVRQMPQYEAAAEGSGDHDSAAERVADRAEEAASAVPPAPTAAPGPQSLEDLLSPTRPGPARKGWLRRRG